MNTILIECSDRKTFKVYKNTFESFPDSMITKMINSNFKESKQKTLFLDINSEVLSIILDFYRCGEVFIPNNVPKTLMEKSLEYYCLPSPWSTVNSIWCKNELCSLVEDVCESYLNSCDFKNEIKTNTRVEWNIYSIQNHFMFNDFIRKCYKLICKYLKTKHDIQICSSSIKITDISKEIKVYYNNETHVIKKSNLKKDCNVKYSVVELLLNYKP